MLDKPKARQNGKRSSLLAQRISDEEKSFKTLTPGDQYYKTSYGRNLQVFVIS